jgi:adhesin transport system outer membrane protein
MRWGGVIAATMMLSLSCSAEGQTNSDAPASAASMGGQSTGASNRPSMNEDVDALTSQLVPAGNRLGLADAVALTIVRHPDIARALAALARGRADVAGARSVWLPSLSYQANLGPNMFSTQSDSGLNDNMQGPGVALNQLVWDFGRSRSQINAASAVKDQRGFELEATADQLAEKAALAYLDVIRAQRQVAEAKRQLDELQRLRRLIELRTTAGISDRSDLLLADVRLESARGDSIQVETSLTSAQAALANLTGVYPAQYDDPTSLLSRFQNRLDSPNFEAIPAVAAARENERAASARIGQAKAERLPRLGLQLGYNRNNYTYDSRNNAFTAMMTVSGDVFRAGTSHVIEAAEQDRKAARATTDSAILDLRGRMLTANATIKGGLQRIDVYGRQEQQAINTREVFIEEYKLGKRSLFDLLNAELEIYRAADARVIAETDVMRARVQLESVYGSLRPSLGLAVHIEQESRR